MAQPSVACYFNTRKRSAVDNIKVNQARKVLVLDSASVNQAKSEPDFNPRDNCVIVPQFHKNVEVDKSTFPNESAEKLQGKDEFAVYHNKIAGNSLLNTLKLNKKLARTVKIKKIKNDANQKSIDEFIGKISQKLATDKIQNETVHSGLTDKAYIKQDGSELNLDQIKNKISRSAKLAELKASISRFKESSNKLEEIEKKTSEIRSPKLKNFKSIQLEVPLSPQKILSPEKPYLSPRKDASVKKNLIGLLSPTKNAVALTPNSPSKKILETTAKPALTLPFKYRYLAEMFRAVDTVCQILYNRKETITFKKLKPAVEEMLKRNLTQKHIAQIKTIYPDAFEYAQEKLRIYGSGRRQEEWELVFKPIINNQEHMTSENLLERRRRLFKILIEKVKGYHNEFLLSLIPPMEIPQDKITRWHPEFDIERVPDIELSCLPQPPVEEKLKTGKEVLEKAREMFSCNTRMEQALERLKAAREAGTSTSQDKPIEPVSVLKGIPKALLEKVRQKQAAKALVSMTRSAEKEKEVLVYSRLPEIARLTRGIFVAEKKNVLPLETVISKLENCYRCYLTKPEMEDHLKVISKETKGWLSFYDIRNNAYVKVVKNSDLSLVISKLEKLVKEKSES